MDTYGTMLNKSNLESIALRLLRCLHIFLVGRIECLFGDGCWKMNLLPPFQRWNFQASQECQSIVLAATWKGLLLENCYVLLRKTPQKYSHATRNYCAFLHGFTIPFHTNGYIDFGLVQRARHPKSPPRNTNHWSFTPLRGGVWWLEIL